ncbi:MAG: hypothetical protein OEY33_04615, partial [Bdellovibrionales bacterium]|nr:hypothetical protein [Bdellovibrionales bacterium]
MFHKKKKSRSLWPKLHSLILNFILCFCLATDTIFINTVYATSGLKSGINAAKDGQEGEPNDDPDVGESFKDAWAKKDCAWGSERDSLLKDNSAQTQKKQCKEACVKKYTDSKDLSSCSTKCDSAEYSAAYESCDSKKGDEYQKCITTNAGSWLQSEGINTGANGEIILSSEKQKKLRDIECAAEKIGWITQFLDLVTRDIDGSCPSAKLAQVGGLIGLADLGIMLFGDLKLRKLQYDYWKKYKDQNKMAKTKQLNDGEESTDDNSLSGSAAKSELKQKNEEAQKAALEYLKKELDELMKIDIAKMTSAALQTAIHAAATGVAAVETAMMFVPPNFGEGFTCKVPVETTNGLLAAADLAAVMGKGKNAKAFAGSASGKKRTAGSGSSKGGSGSGGTKDNSGSSGSGGTGGSKVGSSGTGGSKTVTGKQRFKEGVNKLINVKKLSKSDPEKVTPPKKTVTGKQRFKDAGNKVTKVKTEVSVINKLFGKKVDNPLDPKSKNTTTKGSTSGSSSVGPNKQAIKGGIRSKIGGLWDRLRGKKSGDSDVDVLGSKNKNTTAAGSGTRVASLEPGFVTVKKKGDIDIEDGDVVGNRRAVTKDDIEASWEGLNTDKSRRAKLQK